MNQKPSRWNKKPPRKPSSKKAVIIIILVIVVLTLAQKTEKAKQTPSKSETVTQTTAIETTESSTISETTEPPTQETTEPPTTTETTEPPTTTAPVRDYVLNTSTMKIHKPTCSSVKDISGSNRKDYQGTYDDLIAKGYTGCGKCHPF